MGAPCVVKQTLRFQGSEKEKGTNQSMSLSWTSPLIDRSYCELRGPHVGSGMGECPGRFLSPSFLSWEVCMCREGYGCDMGLCG